MRTFGKLALGVGGIVLALTTGIILADFRPQDDRVLLRARESYTEGAYLAYVQPWGAGKGPFALWANRADSIRLDPTTFPDKTRIAWRWPPFAPPGALSIWGYDHVSYGDYDGGEVDAKVAPLQVKAIQAFRQEFSWTGDFGASAATLLTEFYLRSDPKDAEAKVLEIGWFLHAPEATRAFVAEGRQAGTYRDPAGREWQVSVNEKFLTFLRKDGRDTQKGEIDMLHALQWLREKRLITGEEWITGLAIGVEPMKGFGHVELAKWNAELR